MLQLKGLNQQKGHKEALEIEWDMDLALEQIGGDEEFLPLFLEKFIKVARKDLKRMKDAFDSKDFAGVRAAAHSLKGSSSSFGMKGIYEVSRKIEEISRKGQFEGLSEGLKGLNFLLERAEGILRELKKDN